MANGRVPFAVTRLADRARFLADLRGGFDAPIANSLPILSAAERVGRFESCDQLAELKRPDGFARGLLLHRSSPLWRV
jgi:hypothetical protein